LALADEVGYGCGIALDPFHIALEEKDLISAIQFCKSRVVDFHVADSNRLAAGRGNFDWSRIMAALAEAGYNGALAVECMPPIDRTPLGRFGAEQLESEAVDVSPDQLQFIVDHGSGVLSDRYYTELLRQSAETLRPFLD
jgi:sugar phosphate isomerase/epimerase